MKWAVVLILELISNYKVFMPKISTQPGNILLPLPYKAAVIGYAEAIL